MSTKRGAKLATAGILCAVGAFLVSAGASRDRSVVAQVLKQVPGAKDALAFHGTGFQSRGKQTYESDRSAAPGRKPEDTILVSAPRRVGGAFEVHDGRGGARATVHLARAAEIQPSLVEAGVVTYRDAYPGVDVVAVRDTDRFELGYVAHSEQLPSLELDVAADGGRLRLEPQTGAALLQSAQGRAKLRIAPPVAFDASGAKRRGSYVLADADTLRIVLDVRGMQPPIFIDPAFYIPYWTLVEDARAPGGAVYDENSQSRQGQIVINAGTGRPWLIRPSAPLDISDVNEAVGAERREDWYSSISDTPRTPGQNAPGPQDPLASRDFERTVSRESETYEWRDNGWQLLPHLGLPGFIDPTVAFDPAHSNMFAMGGQLHATTAQEALTAASAVFQNDGTGWVAKGFPGAPPARTRAASAAFGSKLVLFGGRSLAEPYDLFNDTWTFDGFAWKKLPISNPPPACESSQLVYDKRRERLVLIGGNCSVSTLPFQPSDMDGFRLWEFDGTDWIKRFDIVDPTLPRSFQLRRNVAAAWHPIRQTTLLFGGAIDVTEQCAFTPAEVAAKRHQAAIDSQVFHDFTSTIALQNQGCWGGYVHDTWEWDGTTLRQLTGVAFGGRNPPRHSEIPVFRQLSGAIAAPLAGTDSVTGSTTSKLWPWRYDASSTHFAPRSALERSATQPGVPDAAPVSRSATGALAANPTTPPTMVSPMFAPQARPQMVVLPDSGRILIFFANDGEVYETDLTTWIDRTPSTTPFASGQNDFFAAAYDTTRQRTVLFDPGDGVTWEHDAQGWRRVNVATSPGIWTFVNSIAQPWWRDLHQVYGPSTNFPLRPPRMVFDRARNRSVMLHGDALWEFDGTDWTQFATPAALKSCKVSTVMAFDGARNKTVVVGCTVPGQTWEWDGASWAGPFPSPFQDLLIRPLYTYYRGTVELEYLHPNALFESASLGGVGIVDAGGTLRIWKGTGAWETGPWAGDPVVTQAYDNYRRGLSQAPTLATAFYPPVIEDYGANRLLLFRDGIRATRELKLLPQPATSWEDAFVGNTVSGGTGGQGIASVNPFPMELLPLALVYPIVYSDLATSTKNGSPSPEVGNLNQQYQNLFWPLRFLPDPVAKRVHVLTDRGVFWELGSERVSDNGGACTTSDDCKDGLPCAQGVCCRGGCNGRCLTCNGAHPGTCEAIATGSVEPLGRCGAGDCAGVCSGVTQFSDNGFPFSACTFPPNRSCGTGATCSNGQITGSGTCATTGPTCVVGPPTPVSCSGGVKCADGASCKPTCSTPADCQQPNQICSPDGTKCIPDGKRCHNDGECPKFNGCAPDGLSCIPDAVLAEATRRGVTPSTWEAPAVRTSAEIADLLRTAGFRSDDQGRIHFDDFDNGGVASIFDPAEKSPLLGLRSCVYRLEACTFETGNLDACVAAAPRCSSAQPWLGDPAGSDCCPAACLLEYFSQRDGHRDFSSLRNVVDGTCYPGLKTYYEELR